MADNNQMKEILAKLDEGVKSLFESDKYAEYLSVMSRFHNYSTRNTLLIYTQNPDARRVAGYSSWKNNFNRQVKKGEHGIKILAPIAVKAVQESEKLDPVTKQPILDEHGNAMTETVERTFARFKAVSVFDIGQTEGDPLPELAETLTGDVERYELFMDALRAVSPLPIVFEQMPPDTDGVCHFGDRIAIREGMSEIQTVSAVIHEMAHAKLHDRDSLDADGKTKPRRVEETEAESVSYVVCQKFKIDTGANSFGYLGSWAKTEETKELQASLDTIRKAAAELIDGIEENYRALAKERGIDLTEQSRPAAVSQTNVEAVISSDAERKPTLAEVLETQEFEDVHLCHADEEIDLATIVELNKNTLTAQGKSDWADVLSGKVERIYQGAYGLQMDISGVEPQRLTDFSYMLAGYAPVSDYDRWVNQSEEVAAAQQESQEQPETPAEQPEVPADTPTAEPEAPPETPPEREITALQQKALAYAKSRAHLPLQTRLNIIAAAFNCKSAVIEKRLCTGKWRGYTDVSIRFDNGAAIGIGTRRTPETKKQSVIDEFVNDALAYYNPDIIAESKVLAAAALLKREAADNAIAARLGLKPYKLLNVEMNDGSVNASGAYIGWYFVTLEVGGKIVNHLETGLNYDIAGGKVSEHTKAKKYYVAGGLKDSDADFVFNGVGFCSTKDSYSLVSSEDAIKRALETLEKRGGKEGETPMQSENLTPNDKDFWRGHIADFLANNGGKIELGDLELSPFNNHGGLGKFFEVFGENTYKDEFANIVARENTKRTGEPWVAFNFCEGGAYRPDCLRTPTAMPFSEADIFIRQYEPKVRAILQADGGGYDKLDYTVYVRRGDNEVYPISDRYDLGDSKNVSGLYNVLKAETDFYYAHPDIYGVKPTDERFAEDKELAYADLAILKAAVTREYPYVEVEKVMRYADGDRLDQKVFNAGEILSFAEADGKIKTNDAAIRARNVKKYGSPGDGDEELGLAVHFKLPGESEPGVFRVSYLLGDYDEERGGLLKHFEMGAEYYNLCVKNGDYGNVNAMLGGKTSDDAIRLAADYTKIYEALRDSMPAIQAAMEQTAETMILPDPTVTIAEMREYGYNAAELLPLSQARATELFDSGNPVYLLYPDNTEAMVLDIDEIKVHDGLYGIEAGDWERILAAEIPKASENISEADLLHNTPGMFGIYQIHGDTPESRTNRFAPMKELEAFGLTPDRANYELVYTATLPIHDVQTNLHRIFNVFQHDSPECPQDFTGRSVSVSDVITLQWRGEVSSHFVDSVGFKELPSFTGEERPQPTYYQVENSRSVLSESNEKPAPAMAALEADVKAGKPISVADLAKAINSVPGRPPAQKGKSDFLAKIAANKQRAAQASQPAAQKDNQREV
jgi:antirestriction protein ArdC